MFRESFAEQHLDISLVPHAFAGRQTARRFQILFRDPQRYWLRGPRSPEEVVQRKRPLLLHPLPDFRLDFGTMSVPPRRFFGLAGKFRNDRLFHFCLRHVYSSPHCLMYRSAVSLSAAQPVIGRIASPRTANMIREMRFVLLVPIELGVVSH